MREIIEKTKEWCRDMMTLADQMERNGHWTPKKAFEARCSVIEVWETARGIK
jgi:hypothetical protein